MAIELVPLKVNIGLQSDRTHDFPQFNEIAANLRENMDWAYFVDKYGGWHYDQVAGHDDDDVANDSPVGTWIGVILVPDDFAQAAVTQFPIQCSILTELTVETFYENRAHARDPIAFEDTEVLQAIAAKRSLGIAEDQNDRNALNLDHPQRGRRRNKNKTWADFKQQKGITIGG